MEIRENLKNIISYIFVLFIILMGLTLVSSNAKAQSDESEKNGPSGIQIKIAIEKNIENQAKQTEARERICRGSNVENPSPECRTIRLMGRTLKPLKIISVTRINCEPPRREVYKCRYIAQTRSANSQNGKSTTSQASGHFVKTSLGWRFAP